MAGLHKVFKSHIKSMRYVFKDGRIAEFVGGMFHTADEKQIEELTAEVGTPGKGYSKNPSIYIDTEETEVDPTLLTPEAQLRAKIRAEVLAEMKAATNPENNMGTSSAVFADSINNTVKQEVGQVSGDGAVLTELKKIEQTPVVATQQDPKAMLESLKAKMQSATESKQQ